ncbi:MAG: glycine--tRNA ligase [Candidatus Parvarchaeota archaeon]|nr:glycine--tRNA ligase [Candidatus Parvarchaeota archaeon]
MADIDAKLLSISLNRGIFFPSAEIFPNSMGGFWDYGPIGLSILNSFQALFRRFLKSIGAFEISGASVLPKQVLKASGHEAKFFDVIARCSRCNSIYRVDKLLEASGVSGSLEGLSDEEYKKLLKDNDMRCQRCGAPLENIEHFYLMFPVSVGDSRAANAYLRPEACQSIFLDFKRVFESNGKKLPLIISQTGRAFRNEISARESLLRQREFLQSDIEIFFTDESSFEPDKHTMLNIMDENNSVKMSADKAFEVKIIENRVTAFALSKIYGFLLSIGFGEDVIRLRKLHSEKAFYSKESFDIEIKRGDGWVEIASCNYRGNYDLSSYKEAGADVSEVDGVIPSIFEISIGTDRLIYMLLYNSLMSDEERSWFKLKPQMSPFVSAVFPLLSRKELEDKARDIVSSSSYSDSIYYLDGGSIGKRYRKSDEIGVPLAFTVDYQTLDDSTVTVRDRDTMKQFRVKISDVDKVISESSRSDFDSLSKKFSI